MKPFVVFVDYKTVQRTEVGETKTSWNIMLACLSAGKSPSLPVPVHLSICLIFIFLDPSIKLLNHFKDCSNALSPHPSFHNFYQLLIIKKIRVAF